MFNQIPGNIIAPIVAFEVNSGGQFENRSRLLLIGHALAAGAVIAANTPTPCPTIAEARRLAGAGSMLDDMVRMARRNAPAQEIWILAVPETGTKGTRTITIDSAPSAGVGAIQIAGETLMVTVASGDTVAAVATAIAAKINAYFNALTGASLPYTATSALGVVTLTPRHAGAVMDGIDINIPVLDGSNVFSGKATLGATAGAGTPDLSAGLAALGDDEFDWIVSPFSDATNVGRYATLLSDTSGRWAWNRQIYGHVFYPLSDSIANLTTHGLARDSRHLSVIPIIASSNAPNPVWQWAAGLVARIVPWLSDGATGNVSRNQTGLVVEGLLPPRDRAGWLDFATRDAFLGSGLSTWKVNTGGNVVIDKIVTTSRTFNGVPDTTFRDVQKIGQLVYALRLFRTDLTIEHGQKAVADDNPGNLHTISTPADIKATFMHSYQRMVMTGVLENAVKAAELIEVKRNIDNPNRVDIYAPIDVVNPLDVIAANAVVYSQFSPV
ncbi:Mu-like prophage tail sheath protein gpL [Mesorhizobium albiziae]|uniref:Mu-like prophage tail sheath protein gpL n=1 Tax=Neomesorhizobium albiziae TaxID=335020 RepID=A0A1I3YCD1_9HYPH|nr:phage tail sheath subtilisin-like domain-containing protein [Mesorhizobium albiziae]GLS29956.1 tail sheath protein [Mesorhizobium albiziae]SFK29440.1 Mu-like prophage tail sheath protein gpL [Mesorhizobium albiziae]